MPGRLKKEHFGVNGRLMNKQKPFWLTEVVLGCIHLGPNIPVIFIKTDTDPAS